MLVLNFVLFQLGWFACVLFAARGQALWGVAAVLVIVAVHLAFSEKRNVELKLLVCVSFIGLLWDSLLVSTGWVTYPSGMFAALLAPSWIVAMWTLFGTLLNRSLVWLRGRTVLAAVFGLVGGPMAYYGGVRLGAIELNNAVGALGMQAAGWAVLAPLLIRLAEKFDG
jgi:hypothetical protein